MRNLILFGLLIILLLAAQFTAAKTVDEVIEKYLRARGGFDKLTSVKSIYMEGIREMYGDEAMIKIIKEQDKLSRTEISDGTSNDLVLITGKPAHSFFSILSPVINEVPAEDLAALQTEMDIAGPLVNYLIKGHHAELLGKDIVEGNTCYKIRLTTKAGTEMLFWIDRSTYLVSQSSSASISGGRIEKETFTLYKNYKDVDGIKFAHSCETKITGSNAGNINRTISFDKIIINPAIDPSMFSLNYKI